MSEDSPRIAAAREHFREEGLDHTRRHIFICAEAEKGKCCPRSQGAAAWKFLKRRLRELGLDREGGIGPDQSGLPEGLRRRAGRGGLARGHLVSQLQ